MALRQLFSSTEPEFEALLRIYFEAHPEGELKPASALVRMIERPDYFFLVLLEGPSVVAFSISCCFRNSDAALLEYMAVAADRRGRGIGAMLFKQTAGYKAIAKRYLLIEVDSDKGASADRADLVRRKNFYRRLGCREIDGLRYIMPRVSSAEPPAMELLLYRNLMPDTIGKKHIQTWLENCYSHVYHAAPDDRRIGLMLNPLPDTVRLV